MAVSQVCQQKELPIKLNACDMKLNAI